MAKKRIAVILFPGSNCELEAVRACKRSGLEAEIFQWNDKYSKLKQFDAYILPGGFSYEDRGRSGVVAAQDPIMKLIQRESENGKPVLGICNGAQILIECGIVPGFNKNHLEMALAYNERIKNNRILGTGFYNDWVYIRNNATPGRSVFNNFSRNLKLHVPVAHAEGRFVTRQKNVLENLAKNEQDLFRYCDENGKFTNKFPINPNGATHNLAGVCNKEGNVLALMPHPERTINGQAIFDSLKYHLEHSRKTPVYKLKKYSKPQILEEKTGHQIEKPDFVILINLIITDNEERTIENTLKNLGYKNIQLKRQIYLGFYCEGDKNSEICSRIAEKLIRSGEILNTNKEIPIAVIQNELYSFDSQKGLTADTQISTADSRYLVMDYDNYTGKNIQNNIAEHLDIKNIKKVEQGILWTINGVNEKQAMGVIKTHIFHNPHSMKLLALK